MSLSRKCLYLGTVGFFVTISLVFLFPVFPAWDESVYHFFSKIHSPFFLTLNDVISRLGSSEVLYGLSVLGILFFVKKREFFRAFVYGGLTPTALLVNRGLKFFFHRDRPIPFEGEILSSFAYPSGHMVGAVVFYGMTMVLFSFYAKSLKVKKTGNTILFFLIAAIGFSRMALGVHWFSDVVGGFFLGLVFLSWFCLTCLKSQTRQT
ncbi:MAG TPA: hypothetical protein DDW49_03990 [Deltaproteobacteria bacterium]|nr:MAG: hypothetical protein A2048_02550 [Deltaproteobacteria bacterium GWA2_45_12]HBF12540.1 hypothetical protein [Deltaproteobacteria bacterium]